MAGVTISLSVLSVKSRNEKVNDPFQQQKNNVSSACNNDTNTKMVSNKISSSPLSSPYNFLFLAAARARTDILGCTRSLAPAAFFGEETEDDFPKITRAVGNAVSNSPIKTPGLIYHVL